MDEKLNYKWYFCPFTKKQKERGFATYISVDYQYLPKIKLLDLEKEYNFEEWMEILNSLRSPTACYRFEDLKESLSKIGRFENQLLMPFFNDQQGCLTWALWLKDKKNYTNNKILVGYMESNSFITIGIAADSLSEFVVRLSLEYCIWYGKNLSERALDYEKEYLELEETIPPKVK